MSKLRPRVIQSLAAATLLGSTLLNGAGFALIENSASGTGSAYASGGAAGEDASTLWFNPASMTLLKGHNVVVAAHFLSANTKFTNDGSTNADGTPLSGPDSEGGKMAVVPNIFYSAQITDEIFAGIGINAPFGSGTTYDDNWVGRYHAVETDLLTININPAIAYKINDQWSIGGGLNLQYVDLTLTSAVDFGALLGASGSADGFAKLTADNSDSLSYGWNAGLLFNLNETTRFSLAYRSAINHHAEGEADFTVPASASAIVSTGLFADSNIYSDVTLPASASLSAFHSLTEDLDLMADITWTQWSVYDELRIKYDNPLQPDSATTQNYQDQWRVALGGRYQVNKALILRTGLAYDQRAASSEKYLSPRTPDTDRYWVALGMGYAFTDMIAMDLGYSHLFMPETPIDNTYESSQATLSHTLTGDFTSSVDILSAQLTMKF